MAKSKRISLGGKQFFSLVVLSAVAIGILFTANVAIKEQTSTQSEAACLRAPTLTYYDRKIENHQITYYMRLTNNCPGYNQFSLRVIEEPTSPLNTLKWLWTWDQPNCSTSTNTGCYIAAVQGTRNIHFRVFNNSKYNRGTKYERFGVQAALRSNSSLRDRVYFNYIMR